MIMTKRVQKLLDEFVVLPEHVIVSDPCYKKGTWCAAELTDVLSGKYYVDFYHAEEDSWGGHQFVLVHENYKRGIMPKEFLDIELGIDAGMVGVYPENEFRNDSIVPPTEELYFENELGWYSAIIPHNEKNQKPWKIMQNCFTSESGYGDGVATLFVDRNKDKKIVRIGVKF